jgi:6,7-dimethyl-8-ribityllumazine synthase
VTTIRGAADARGRRFAIVASRFNELVVTKLVDGARAWFERHGVGEGEVDIVWVPGAFELAIAARRLASTGDYDAVVCLGAVIRGETPHFDHVATQAAEGIRRAGEETGVPVVFGVLTTNTFEQAIDRAGGAHGNKGWDSAAVAAEMASVLEQLPKAEP